MCRFLGRAALAATALSIAVTFFDPDRNPARQRGKEIALVVALALALPVFAVETIRRISASGHSRNGPNPTASQSSRTLRPRPPRRSRMEFSRRLPRFRQGKKPATRFVMERDERKEGMRTLVFDYECLEYGTMWWFPLGSTPRVRRVTVVAFHRTRLHLPSFELLSTAVTSHRLDDDPPWKLIELPEHPRF